MSATIAEKLNEVKQFIPPGITLVAVSKTKPEKLILEAYVAGQRDFGENYVQELTAKQPNLPKDIRWHFIGHLQSNKVKYIAPFVHLIHGVDSLKLLQEINKQGLKNNRVINCLLQVFIASEETKFGLDENELYALLNDPKLNELKHISIKGLMGMASNTEDEKQVEKEFSQIHSLFKKIKSEYQNPNISFEYLSTGMSGDYQLAIANGSNMVRIGSLIFGSRN